MNKTQIDAVMAPLRIEARRLKDAIMLGDATAAQAALELFQSKVDANG